MASLNAQYDDDPEGYDRLRRCWLNERRRRYIEGWVRRLPPGAQVLEVGAGTGGLLIELAAAHPELSFVGVEPLREYVEFARRRAAEGGLSNVRFECATAEDLAPELVGRNDLVLTNDVLHHVRDEREAARAIRASVAPSARWLAIEPSWINPWVLWYHTRTEGERLFFPRRFGRAAEGAGWRTEGSRKLFLIPTAIADPPDWMKRAEQALERVPVLAGGVAVEYVAV